MHLEQEDLGTPHVRKNQIFKCFSKVPNKRVLPIQLEIRHVRLLGTLIFLFCS